MPKLRAISTSTAARFFSAASLSSNAFFSARNTSSSVSRMASIFRFSSSVWRRHLTTLCSLAMTGLLFFLIAFPWDIQDGRKLRIAVFQAAVLIRCLRQKRFDTVIKKNGAVHARVRTAAIGPQADKLCHVFIERKNFLGLLDQMIFFICI